MDQHEKVMNIADFKNQLGEAMSALEAGESIVLARRNVPFARIEPIKALRKNKYKPGNGIGTVEIHGDIEEPAIPLSDYDCFNGTEPH